jgi:hypothetical protein
MNRSQETRLQYLNDNYGVASWEERRGSVFVTLDDGDRAEIHPEGTATFESANQPKGSSPSEVTQTQAHDPEQTAG